MSGHSQWKNIKYRKEITDKKRAQAFSKLAKEITITARKAGSDPTANPILRSAIERAREFNMPKENIERAIKKGTGEIAGAQLEEVLLEGYGPGGVALLVKIITDNKNRTISEMRHIFSQHEAKLAEPGAVQWAFQKTDAGWEAQYEIEADENTRQKLEKLFTALDEHDDVQEIYSNLA